LLGYLGFKDGFPTVKYVVPFRKKRKSELSDEEKKYNRKQSKLRIIVEHTISRIKKFGIMGTKFRNIIFDMRDIHCIIKKPIEISNLIQRIMAELAR
jgi:hypothetical protein